MKSILIILNVLLAISVLYLTADYRNHKNYPKPKGIFSSYGFKPGIRVTRTEIKENPFDVAAPKVDTFTVKDVKGEYIQFTNNQTNRIGSIGMDWYNWEKVD